MAIGLVELIFILIFVLLGLGIVRGLGRGRSRRGLESGGRQDFESRVLDELDVIRLRMDVLGERLDKADVPELPPGDPDGSDHR
ncbi:hypothetical protein ACFL0I_00215 [Gemmatimonadota bacterium]